MYTNIDKDIQGCDWITDTTKANLLQLYNSVRLKDISESAMYLLAFDGNDKTPYMYKDVVMHMIRCLALEGPRGLLGNMIDDANELLYKLFLFLDTLDCQDFDKLIAIENLTAGDGKTKEEKEKQSFDLLELYEVNITK